MADFEIAKIAVNPFKEKNRPALLLKTRGTVRGEQSVSLREKKKSIIYSSKLKMITMMSDVVYLIYIYKYTTQIFNNIIYS